MYDLLIYSVFRMRNSAAVLKIQKKKDFGEKRKKSMISLTAKRKNAIAVFVLG